MSFMLPPWSLSRMPRPRPRVNMTTPRARDLASLDGTSLGLSSSAQRPFIRKGDLLCHCCSWPVAGLYSRSELDIP